jgi:DNA-binding beta-propeller fold protein YncE
MNTAQDGRGPALFSTRLIGGNMEKRRLILVLLGLLLASTVVLSAQGQNNSPLKLIQKIPMPNVKGRLDHFGVDLGGRRLFVAALGDDQNTVEVIDLKMGKRVFSIPGQSKPQGLFYSPEFKKLFVANGTDGTCKIFTGDTFKLMDSLPIGADADHVGYDPATKYLYLGFGDAKSGGLAIIDTRNNKHIGDIKTDSRPGGIKIEQSRPQVFVTLSGATHLGVVDLKKRELITAWPTGVQSNVALALDESDDRLFDGVRDPATLIVLDTESGKQISQLEGVPGIDDLWYDAQRKRIYASGGRGFEVGFVYVYQQKDADHYELIGKVPTAPGAGTSFWSPDLNRIYVAAPSNEKEDAAILVFEPQS